ncbi:MAG: 2-succinyl-6-hydroxy-2,4-cyclohexadiene-1-carboxylate synthase, partial [Ignavibacteriae bacterium]|nr:2-succinyl-6-hydroxy-2,4-cyclohexadiene-1-carboxylate synthase [Ignavibacteriota bacterium]
FYYEAENISSKTPIVFLHGFTGNLNDWKFLINKLPPEFTLVIIDLIGHGKSSSPDSLKYYSSKSQIIFLNKIFEKLNLTNIILVGYSMGGRLTLDFTFAFPENVQAIVLESSSFGLTTKIEKEERIINDRKIAELISKSSIEDFITYWINIPLFNSLKSLSKKKYEKNIKEKIKSNNSIGLKNSLIGFSTGKMKNYFRLANKINQKALLITGELDNKFTNIAEKANNILPNTNFVKVKNAGHNVHLEKPQEFLKLLNTFLLKIRNNK